MDDDFDFDEESDGDATGDSLHGVDEPEARSTRVFRITVVGERLTLAPWMHQLAEGGAMGTFFRLRERESVVIADLQLVRDADGESDVFVEFMAAGAARAAAERRLARWARDTGHRRIWFPDRPVELQRDPARLATAMVACPTCGSEWVDSTHGFWLETRGVGHFPYICPVCAGLLPQWTVRRGDRTGCRGRAARGQQRSPGAQSGGSGSRLSSSSRAL